MTEVADVVRWGLAATFFLLSAVIAKVGLLPSFRPIECSMQSGVWKCRLPTCGQTLTLVHGMRSALGHRLIKAMTKAGQCPGWHS